MKHKILIVGSGFFGSILAHELVKKGYYVDIIDKRNHYEMFVFKKGIKKNSIFYR